MAADLCPVLSHSAALPLSATRRCALRREPLGVVGLVTPWNYPLLMVTWKASRRKSRGHWLATWQRPPSALRHESVLLRTHCPRIPPPPASGCPRPGCRQLLRGEAFGAGLLD